MRVGVLKPDHLGDLVLSAPAIAALRRRFPDLKLFCHPRNQDLAAHLFPGLHIFPFHMPHLDKDLGPGPDYPHLRALLRAEVDLLVALRWDYPSERLLTIPEIEFHTPGPDSMMRHVAVDHRMLVAPLTGPYDLLESYVHPLSDPGPERPARLRRVGLCISAGFRLNAWPLNHWLDLAGLLYEQQIRVVLIGGPAERTRLAILSETIESRLGYRPSCIVGSSDFGATLTQVREEVELVIATDSGTAHLTALVRPVLSLFGGSPWRRFAPLGRWNAIISRRYWCSPCQQFHRTTANACHTQECLTGLHPAAVLQAFNAYLAGLDLTQERLCGDVWLTAAPWDERAAARQAA